MGHIGQEDENVETGQRADLLPYHGYVSIAKNRIIKITCALKPRYLEKNACKTAGDSFSDQSQRDEWGPGKHIDNVSPVVICGSGVSQQLITLS